MSYSGGLLDRRITLIQPFTRKTKEGDVSGYALAGEAWANVTWARGARALRQGYVEAYQTVMVRMRWRHDITPLWRFIIEGRFYTIDSFNADKRANTIQITAGEVPAFQFYNGSRW